MRRDVAAGSVRLVAGLFALLLAVVAHAHEVRPAYLELREMGDGTHDVLFKVPGLGDDLRLALYVELPANCVEVSAPRGSADRGAFTQRWTVRCAGGLTGRTIRIAGLRTTATDVLVRIERSDATTRSVRLTPDKPAFVVEAASGTLEVARTYGMLGVEHILFGVDHLLFVLALLLLVRGWRRLVGTITAFTVAHSITLAAATLGFVHVPGPPVEATIALSIVFVARELARRDRSSPGLAERSPWLVAFVFGLLHGLGFANALSDAGLPQQAIAVALLCFNLGVEAGQLLFVAAVLAIVAVLRRVRRSWPPSVDLAAPYAIGATSMFWVFQRIAAF